MIDFNSFKIKFLILFKLVIVFITVLLYEEIYKQIINYDGYCPVAGSTATYTYGSATLSFTATY